MKPQVMRCFLEFVRHAIAVALFSFCVSPAQADSQQKTVPPQFRQEGLFVAYEIFEMSMNEFRNFAGEVGYRFNSNYQARLTIMNVDLTERHLASKWESAAVEGKNVTGYFRGYEAHVDRFFSGNWYVQGNVGYYEDKYVHTKLPNKQVDNWSYTVGSGIGYSRANLFGIQGLFLNFDYPVRYYFHPIKKTFLGDTEIREHIIVDNVWLFVGYKF